MKTKCYSVRLQSLTSISDKAFKATAFDGSEAIIPKSQVFGMDYDTKKSDAYWIAIWLMDKKEIQFSRKKTGWFNHHTHCMEPNITTIVEHHVPNRIEPKQIEADETLVK